MSLQYLNFNAIAESDLIRLVTDGVGESKTLEYKEALVLATDDQKREFLSDVSALANADGGDLVLGVRADKGVAVDLVGLKNLVPDDALGRIENLLRDSIQPRLAGVQIRALPLSNGNHALLVRAPRSFSAPHMVRHQGVTRFCGRNSNGKYDLDVHELRSAFLASETLSERLKSFRIERINRLLGGNSPVQMEGKHLLVLHIFPVVGARADTRVSSEDFQRLLGTESPTPMGSSGWSPGFSFDGLLVRSGTLNQSCKSFVQITRSGFLEAVNSYVLEPRPLNNSTDLVKFIPSIAWEKYIVDVMPRYLKALGSLNLPPPYVVSISLLNVKAFFMYVGPRYCGNGACSINQDHLLTDEILIESTSESPDRLLRPLFDQVWNACGWHGSINYDKNGDWREHQ